MQLVFAINVIITLLMLKPATSETCDYAGIFRVEAMYITALHIHCKENNTYLKELRMTDYGASSCCKADDPSYANQLKHCSFEYQRSKR